MIADDGTSTALARSAHHAFFLCFRANQRAPTNSLLSLSVCVCLFVSSEQDPNTTIHQAHSIINNNIINIPFEQQTTLHWLDRMRNSSSSSHQYYQPPPPPAVAASLLYPPKTPPRRSVRASNLTPAATPFVTPSQQFTTTTTTTTSTTTTTTTTPLSQQYSSRTGGLRRTAAGAATTTTAAAFHPPSHLSPVRSVNQARYAQPQQQQQQQPPNTPLTTTTAAVPQTPTTTSRRVPPQHPSTCLSRYGTPAQQQAPSTPGQRRGCRSSNNNNNSTLDDRFIPSRRHTNLDLCRRALLSEKKRPRSAARNTSSSSSSPEPTSGDAPAATASQETPLQKEFKRRMLSSLCNVPLSKLDEEGEPTGLLSFASSSSCRASLFSQRGGAGTGLQNHHPSSLTSMMMPTTNPFDHDTLRSMKLGGDMLHNHGFPDDALDVGVAQKVLRKVPSAPFRILDAPDIVDDYYLNLISWSKDNILAVALSQSVYLWNATTGEISHLVTLESPSDYVTSVNWCTLPGQTRYIAVGTNAYAVHLFDAQALRKVRTLLGHTGRVGSLAWNQHWISSGSRDSMILNHDIRAAPGVVAKYRGHQQEVCGLKWNDDGTCLASGGNENFLCLWDAAMSGSGSNSASGGGRSIVMDGGGGGSSSSSGAGRHLSDQTPRLTLQKHRAAVKALDWCPFHRGLLASGGGTSDRTIKFWNTSSGAMLNSIDTGSQVCSIVWSKHQRELCSSHGYSENQLILWKYPSMTRIKELPGHTARVLNMEMSPDGASVVSAAADETLRFWNVFGNSSAFCRAASGAGGGGGGGAGSGGGVGAGLLPLPLAGDWPLGNHTHTIR